MSHFDDLPQRHSSHETEAKARRAFENALISGLFQIQSTDKKDYGSDVQLELLSGSAMTNLRLHIQLKGTSTPFGADGSVAVRVKKANLNYLLNGQDSLYVCFHLPSSRLYVRAVDDVLSKYQHGAATWDDQATVTIRFIEYFDEAFQQRLHARLLARGTSLRDVRAKWASARPEEKTRLINESVPHIEIPLDPLDAGNFLSKLYESGNDDTISAYFDQFDAVLIGHPMLMMPALFAEIDRSTSDKPFKRERLERALELLRQQLNMKTNIEPGLVWYCIGNAFSGLSELEQAKESYLRALVLLDASHLRNLEAQCYKNFGTVLEKQGHESAARAHYERALDIDPALSEAHMAMANWHRKNSKDALAELKHLDQVDVHRHSAVPTHAVLGWRLDAQFRLGNITEAFRDIRNLLGLVDKFDWAWPWSASRVAQFGKSNSDAATLSLRFWKLYIREHPAEIAAKAEQFGCAYMLKMASAPVELTYFEFVQLADAIAGAHSDAAAPTWDRVGHWAQNEKNWVEAETAFRKAYTLDAAGYAYCLSVALNHLGRHEEVVSILSDNNVATKMDSVMWFQKGVAQATLGDFEGAIRSYRCSVEEEDTYAKAWFNLGGAYWNNREFAVAAVVWREAVRKFPDDPLATTVTTEFGFILSEPDAEN